MLRGVFYRMNGGQKGVAAPGSPHRLGQEETSKPPWRALGVAWRILIGGVVS